MRLRLAFQITLVPWLAFTAAGTTLAQQPVRSSQAMTQVKGEISKSTSSGEVDEQVVFQVDPATATRIVASLKGKENSAQPHLRLEANGQILQEMDLDVMSVMASYSLESMQVMALDLDEDGAPEITVAFMTGSSNGMGVEFWDVLVFDGKNYRLPPATVLMHDYGVFGGFVRSQDDHKWRLLETHWKWGKDPKRGDGLYLVGQWLVYIAGEFKRDELKPIIARRYLYGFAKARCKLLGADVRHLTPWYQSKQTRVITNPKKFFMERQ
jgi:hypothetical protein